MSNIPPKGENPRGKEICSLYQKINCHLSGGGVATDNKVVHALDQIFFLISRLVNEAVIMGQWGRFGSDVMSLIQSADVPHGKRGLLMWLVLYSTNELPRSKFEWWWNVNHPPLVFNAWGGRTWPRQRVERPILFLTAWEDPVSSPYLNCARWQDKPTATQLICWWPDGLYVALPDRSPTWMTSFPLLVRIVQLPAHRKRKWGNLRWRTKVEGLPYCTTATLGTQNRTQYYSKDLWIWYS